MNFDGVQAHGFEILERFELGVAKLRWRGCLVEAPVVDGWLQIEREVLRAPTDSEEQEFFAAFAAVRRATAGAPWYWLHKPPGLKLRFRIGADAAQAARLLAAVEALQLPWLGGTSIGAFFDQAELRPLAFRADVDAWLHAAAETQVDAAERAARADADAWTTMLVALVRRLFRGDDWLAFAALGRLERLRAPRFGEPGASRRTFDPTELAQRLPPPATPSFESSVSFLQTLNMIFNLWALDAAGQTAALTGALQILRPALLRQPP